MERKQLYWEDVQVGKPIPTFFSLKLDMTRMVHAVSGTQDFYPVHHDANFAKSIGMPDIFVMTAFLQGGVSRLLTDWMGPEGWVRKVRLEFRKMNLFGDTVTFRGKVTKKYEKDGEHYVDADVWVENTTFGIAIPGKATIILPSKGN